MTTIRLNFWLLAFDVTFWMLPDPPARGWRWRLHMWAVERLSDATDWGTA